MGISWEGLGAILGFKGWKVGNTVMPRPVSRGRGRRCRHYMRWTLSREGLGGGAHDSISRKGQHILNIDQHIIHLYM